jgi:alpha-galactosidase/6-phospho-beta-glucosidase family protein
MPIKVAVIGAGSVGFTRGITRDILCVPELQDAVFAYHDIDAQNLDMLTQLGAAGHRSQRGWGDHRDLARPSRRS